MSHKKTIFKNYLHKTQRINNQFLWGKEIKEERKKNSIGVGEVRARARINTSNDFILFKMLPKNSRDRSKKSVFTHPPMSFHCLKTAVQTILQQAFISIQPQISPLVNFYEKNLRDAGFAYI